MLFLLNGATTTTDELTAAQVKALHDINHLFLEEARDDVNGQEFFEGMYGIDAVTALREWLRRYTHAHTRYTGRMWSVTLPA